MLFSSSFTCFVYSGGVKGVVQIVEHSHRHFDGLERQYTYVVHKILICMTRVIFNGMAS
jgi:hypothetical protein